MGIIFINYRREETAGEARALYNDLVALLGSERVFMDVDNIALGRDFRQVLHEYLDKCEIVLALIGRDWAEVKDAKGQRRLDQPHDFVRQEIATALQRNVAVTPVLLQGACMPTAEILPEDLKGLAFRNGFELSHQSWQSNVHELVRRLGLPAAGQAPAPRRRFGTAWRAGIGIAVLAAAVGLWYTMLPAPATTPSPASLAGPTATADPAIARGLVADLVGTDKASRQTAADRLEREFLRSQDAVRMAVAQLDWSRFRSLSGAAPRSQLLRFLLVSDEAAWTPELRAQAGRAIASLRAQIAAHESSFRPEIVTRIEELGKRLGV